MNNVNNNLSRICTVCEQPSNKRCGKCFTTKYCNREHQVADWTNHKPHCATLREQKKKEIARRIKKLVDESCQSETAMLAQVLDMRKRKSGSFSVEQIQEDVRNYTNILTALNGSLRSDEAALQALRHPIFSGNPQDPILKKQGVDIRQMSQLIKNNIPLKETEREKFQNELRGAIILLKKRTPAETEKATDKK